MDQLNEGRPPFYECNMTDIRNQLIGNSSLYHRNCNSEYKTSQVTRKTCLRGLRSGPTQIALYNYRRWLDA